MFYLLHRSVKVFCWALLAALCVWLYQQREALEPVLVWYRVYDNGGLANADQLPVLEGRGLAVIDGHTFQLKKGSSIYSVRLTGFEMPSPPLPLEEINLEKERRLRLRDLVVSKDVRVHLTYSNYLSVLGIVQVGGTNVNTHFITAGLGHFNRDYVKSAPREDQYRFFAAARAREKKLAAENKLALR